MIFIHSMIAAGATGLIAYLVFVREYKRINEQYRCSIARCASAELALRRAHAVVHPLAGLVATADMSIEQQARKELTPAFPAWVYEADAGARDHFKRWGAKVP